MDGRRARRRGDPGGRRSVAAYLSGLSGEELAVFSRHSGVDLSGAEGDAESMGEALDEVPGSLSDLLAVTGVRVSGEGEAGLALKLARAATEVARTDEEAQVAHVCLAQVNFRERKDPERLAAFEENCLKAVELGHAGTFCYERLAVLYEHRGEPERAAELCERAILVLQSVGDARSAGSFEKRLQRLRTKLSR